MLDATSNATMSAITTAGALSLTALVPGVNAEALIGAFGGAAVFALHAADTSILKRLIYMGLSMLIGYMGAGEVMVWTGITSWTLASFALSAVVVTAATTGIDRIRQFDLGSLLGIFRRGK